MTDQTTPPSDRDPNSPSNHEVATEPVAREPEAPTTSPEPSRSRPTTVILTVIGFVVLAGAIAYLWQQQNRYGSAAEFQALHQQISSLADRFGQLEQASQTQSAEVKSLADKVTTLQQRQPPDLSRLQGRIAAVEQQVAGVSHLSDQIDSLAQKVQSLTGQDQQANDALRQRLDADEAQLAKLQKAAAQLSNLTDRANRLAQLQAAGVALDAGQPLGEIPGAPSALTRYAAAKPPTEAALRLAFPAAERKAIAVSQPDVQDKPFLARVLARAEDLVTVRQGDHVLVGDQSAGVLARARVALEAGDLAGAVAAVSDLTGPPAEAMADWLAKAKALLAARAALANMAAHS